MGGWIPSRDKMRIYYKRISKAEIGIRIGLSHLNMQQLKYLQGFCFIK